MRPTRELTPEHLPGLLATRQVAQELVALGDEAARNQSRLDGARARQHRDRKTGIERSADEPGAGVVDRRKTRVGDESDPLAGLETRHDLGYARRFVVLVVAERARLDSV